jgi:hypothetical protein
MDEKLKSILSRFHGDEEYNIYTAIAEIKAAILAEMPEQKPWDERFGDFMQGQGVGYNQAVTEITEKLK